MAVKGGAVDGRLPAQLTDSDLVQLFAGEQAQQRLLQKPFAECDPLIFFFHASSPKKVHKINDTFL